jgi:hypothetical protein
MVFAGLPYMLLSANSALIQTWLAAAGSGPDGSPPAGGSGPADPDSRGVYRLYAVSNLGSLLGLLAYPFILEPHVPLTAQWWGFAACLAGYAALVSLVGRQTRGADGGALAAAADALRLHAERGHDAPHP